MALTTPHAEVAPGEAGELLFRGPALMVRYGYEGNPAATAATTDDDCWLLASDLVWRDSPTETVRLLDRLTDTMDVVALNASPVEFEAALRDAPGVADAAVVSTPVTVLA